VSAAERELELVGELPVTEPANGSLLERLRAQRAARVESHLDIVIPDWGADTEGLTFIARMRRIPWKGPAAQALHRLQRASGTGGASADAELAAECDLLAAGLDQLYVRDGTAEAVPLDAEEPMRFDPRTAVLLGIDAVRPRDVVQGVFGGELGQFALKAAAARYLGWLQQVEVVGAEEGKG
jgi:hypothetical protein